MAEKKTKGKKTGIGLALWLLAALLILIIFLVNQDRIAGNLKATGFFNKTGLKTPEFVEKAEVKSASVSEKNEVAPIETIEIDLNGIGSHTEESEPELPAENIIPKNETAKKQQEVSALEKQEELPAAPKKTEKEASVRKEISVSTPPKDSTMKLKLYFMSINSDGSVSRKEVTREMKKSDSPLVDAVNALIKGPIVAEENSGCRSLVSENTRLIGASVKNGVATLNFSGDFEFNRYGIEGLRGQLQQIVFTATAFPTVENVQFLVDGEKKEYLGSEGVWIGTPLNRNSF
ncbi:GerMN domain-containing protein [Treponema sp.]|uniref:GerMN domain-containing protein n=1 Tax=Treponema sp. TaxID=166 RepID=UPI003F05F70B